ncbi:hypothetical protein Tco_0879199 [Tanacetum coccineum]
MYGHYDYDAHHNFGGSSSQTKPTLEDSSSQSLKLAVLVYPNVLRFSSPVSEILEEATREDVQTGPDEDCLTDRKKFVDQSLVIPLTTEEKRHGFVKRLEEGISIYLKMPGQKTEKTENEMEGNKFLRVARVGKMMAKRGCNARDTVQTLKEPRNVGVIKDQKLGELESKLRMLEIRRMENRQRNEGVI